MKGRIFTYAKYKAWNEKIITSRVNPRKTSRECHRCHRLVIRYHAGQPMEGYTPGASLVLCEHCSMQGHADRNASLVIGQRLIARSQEPRKEKPPAPVRRAGRESKDSGVVLSQDATRESRPSPDDARHGDGNGHGTAQERRRRMGASPLSYSSPTPLATGVGATPSVSGKRLRRSGRSRSVSTEAECHRCSRRCLIVLSHGE
jgi:hypothetical protein